MGSMFSMPISIHPPLAGRDVSVPGCQAVACYFNPPAPRGARPCLHNLSVYTDPISIHPPLAGRDAWPPSTNCLILPFQSTRPSRGETRPA